MNLLFSNDWLRSKIAADQDIDIEAGRPLSVDEPQSNAAVISGRNVVQLRMALGVLVRQLRQREQLSVTQLAERAVVSEDDLRRVEHDPHYTAGPRLIYQLSHYFNVSLSQLSQMAGATHAVNRSLYNEAVRYAARSDDVSALSAEERRDLDAFVAVLNERSKA